MLKKFRKLEVGVRVETRNDNHIRAQVPLLPYVYEKGYINVVESEPGYVWLFMTILQKDEKKFYHDISVMQMIGIDIKG